MKIEKIIDCMGREIPKDRCELISKLDFHGIKGVKACKEFVEKHNLKIDELAAMRALGKMTMGQYAACLSVEEPWFNLIQKE